MSQSQNYKSLLNELKELHRAGRKSAFRRAEIAWSLLRDPDYLATVRDEGEALTLLAAMFDDILISGDITLSDILDLYNWCSDRSKWEQQSLRMLYAEMRAANIKRKTTTADSGGRGGEVERLREELQKARAENSALKARVRVLESRIKRMATLVSA